MHVYDEIDIPRIINAAGSMTYLGGSLIHPDILEAMRQAGEAYVFIDDLLDWASSEITKQTGADAGLVTTGTTGGIILSAAACLTGMDSERMHQLPNTNGRANEFIMQSQHRISFDRAIRTAGGKIVEVGHRECTQIKDVRAAINEKTVAIFHTILDPQPAVPLKEIVKLANERAVPVIVDAAAELPPVCNLQSFLSEGADLVIFSGGKAMCGPNDTGFLCGRADLIKAARAQAFPNAGIGRALKVSKEQIIGLIYALQRFVQIDWNSEQLRWEKVCEKILHRLKSINCTNISIAYATHGARPLIVPRVCLTIDPIMLGKDLSQIDYQLERGKPAIAVVMDENKNEIWLNPQHLHDNQINDMCSRLIAVIGSRKN